jgi:hypothetical protein
MTSRRRNLHPRAGVSLIEVIACTAIVGVMIVPIAGVIRASGQSIQAAAGSNSTQATLRTGLRWVAQTIRDGQVLAVQNRRLTLKLADGRTARIEVRGNQLLMISGSDQSVLADGVREAEFRSLVTGSSPPIRVGVSITLRARDASGAVTSIAASVAYRPQI